MTGASIVDRAAGEALVAWLSGDEVGREVLAHFAADPETGKQALTQWVQARAKQAPPQVALYVSGGQVDKIIQIAEAGVVVTPDTARDVSGLANPYLGLRAFTYAERAGFAGREAAVEQLTRLVTAAGAARVLQFVIGASGSGKSSFVQAGLVPTLEARYQQRGMTVGRAVFQPGARPVAALADALAGLASPPRATLEMAAINSASALTTYLSGSTPQTQINLVVIDQFEELFTQSDADQRDVLLALLSNLPEFAAVRTHFIATLRSDYLGAVWPRPVLSDLASAQGFGLREMSETELSTAIERPLQARAEIDERYRGKAWEPELVTKLAREAAPDAAYLPLLQLTLSELWRLGRLTLGAYEALGESLARVLEKRATTILQFVDHDSSVPTEPRPEADQQLIMRILIDLVQVSVEGSDRPTVRVRRTREDLEGAGGEAQRAARRRLIDDLASASARLLSLHRDGDLVTVDLIHESLIANWDRMRAAIEDERQHLGRRARFEQALREWYASNRSRDYLLTGVRLAEARELAGEGDIALRDGDAQLLLRRSNDLDREELNRTRRRLALAAGAIGVALVALVVMVFALRSANEAKLINSSRELAAESTSRRDADPELGILLARAGLDVWGTSQAESALRGALVRSPVRLLLRGSGRPIKMATYSPDGGTVLVGADDGTARLFDSVSGALKVELAQAGGRLTAASYSPDGRRIAIGSADGSVRLFDTGSGAQIAQLLFGTSVVNDLAFSPNGALGAVAGADGVIRLWDAQSGAARGQLSASTAAALSVSFSHDSTRLVAGSADAVARVWDLTGGQLVTELRGHSDWVQHAVFDAADARVATSSVDRTARVWDARSGALIHELRGHEQAVSSVDFSPDGALVLTASLDQTAREWDTFSGEPRQILRGHGGPVQSAAFSPDGRTIVTAGYDSTARVWDTVSGEPLLTLRGHRQPLASARFGPDNVSVVTGSLDGTVRTWRIDTGRDVVPLGTQPAGIFSAVFSPDGERVATGSADTTIRIWPRDGRGDFWSRGFESAVMTVAFSPNRRQLAVGQDNGAVQIVSPDGSAADLTLSPRSGTVYTAVFSPDGSRLVGTSGDHLARVWDAIGGQLVGELRGHTDEVTGAAYAADGGAIATGSADGTVRLWSAGSLQPLRELRGHMAKVYRVAFSPDGHRLISGGADSTARVWDVDAGREIATLRGHDGRVFGVAYSPRGDLAASAGSDGRVLVWDTSTWQRVAELGGPSRDAQDVNFSPDGERIVVAGADGVARVYPSEWFAPLGRLLALVPSRVTRDFTSAERVDLLHEPPPAGTQ